MINPKLVNAACVMTIIYVALQLVAIGGMLVFG